MNVVRYDYKRYPDNTGYPLIQSSGDTLLFRLDSYEDLWVLNQISDSLSSREVDLYIPYLLHGQGDRRFNNNTCHELRLICKFLNKMNWRSINIFHPHNSDVVEALIPNYHAIDNSELVSKVIEEVKPDLLVSLDAGGYKSLSKVADKIGWNKGLTAFSKSRNGSEVTMIPPSTNLEGKKILIVDDICIYGGSLIKCLELLPASCEAYVCVSHMTQTPKADLFKLAKGVYTTSSFKSDMRCKLVYDVEKLMLNGIRKDNL